MTSQSLHGVARTRLMLMLCLVLGVMAGTSCSMNLRPQPETGGLSLAGHWQLQSPSREALADNLRAVMEQARAAEEQRERRRYPRSIPPQEGTPESAAATPPATNAQPGGPGPMFRRSNWEMREQREHQESLLAAVLPSNKLLITQSAGRLEMLPDTGGRRRFDMELGSTLVKSYATLRIESGWQANVFVVHSRDRERGIDIVERYQRVGNGLRMQVQLSLPDAKDQIFAADYVLATP